MQQSDFIQYMAVLDNCLGSTLIFFLQVLGVPSSFFALQGGGQFFFVSANFPIPTN